MELALPGAVGVAVAVVAVGTGVGLGFLRRIGSMASAWLIPYMPVPTVALAPVKMASCCNTLLRD